MVVENVMVVVVVVVIVVVDGRVMAIVVMLVDYGNGKLGDAPKAYLACTVCQD